MPDNTLEVIEYRLRAAEAEIKKLHEELEKREREEKSRLIWGIGVLGAAVMTLAGVIWNWRSVIIRGSP